MARQPKDNLFSEGGDATTTDFLAFTRKTDGPSESVPESGDGFAHLAALEVLPITSLASLRPLPDQ
jgi:hypothetical protein